MNENKTKIEIKGIKYYLGLGFLNELVNGTGKQLKELGIIEEVLLYPILIYYSRLYACKRLGLAVDFTQEDIFEYIDDNGGVSGEFYNEFAQAYLKAMTQDVPEYTNKKKVTKKVK